MVHSKKVTRNQIRAGVIGHAIGDALGVPVEFLGREQLRKRPVKGMTEFGTHRMPIGTWSDDTSMEVALLESLISCERFDYEDIMSNFKKWHKEGEFTATGKMFDIGGTCLGALRRFNMGTEPLDCGKKGTYDNGNGSLMRILPVAFVCHDMEIIGNERYELVRKVSSLTHAHEISVMGCLIYINFICHLLDGDELEAAYANTQKDDYSMFDAQNKKEYVRILTSNITGVEESKIRSGGYVVNTLEASLWCLLNTNGYKKAVLKAVNLGEDTDTVGAVTGSMAGVYYGYEAIPKEWIKILKRSDYLITLCDEFHAAQVEL